jgi:hypothetical protein
MSADQTKNDLGVEYGDRAHSVRRSILSREDPLPGGVEPGLEVVIGIRDGVARGAVSDL